MQASTFHGFSNNADMHAYLSRPDDPCTLTGSLEPASIDNDSLPEKSENQKEIDRHRSYFDFVDQAKTRLDKRGLLEKPAEGSTAFTVKPDAGERLRDFFSSALTSITSIGATSDVATTRDTASGLIFNCCSGMVALTGAVFAFNTIVSALANAFPSHKAYFDQAGRLTYQLASAVHTVAATVQPAISGAVSSESNPVVIAVLVSIEILLGIYATCTGLENTLARQMKKSEILAKLITHKQNAEIFFKKTLNSEPTATDEAEAYHEFMDALSKFDSLSAEAGFGNRVAQVTAVKESLWCSGSVVGNETAYKNLGSVGIGVSVPELVGTAAAEMFLGLVANVIDLVQGVIVGVRCGEKIDRAIEIKNKMRKCFDSGTSKVTRDLKQGLVRMLDRKIEDEDFEQGFSMIRVFKAIATVTIGIIGIVGIILFFIYAAPVWGGLAVISGIAAFIFFVVLLVRTSRTSSRAMDEKREKDDFMAVHDLARNAFQTFKKFERFSFFCPKILKNRYLVLHALSVALVAGDTWKDKEDLKAIFSAFDFSDIDMDILSNLAKMEESEAEKMEDKNAEEEKEKEIQDKEKKIEIVKKNLERMFELKMNFA